MRGTRKVCGQSAKVRGGGISRRATKKGAEAPLILWIFSDKLFPRNHEKDYRHGNPNDPINGFDLIAEFIMHHLDLIIQQLYLGFQLLYFGDHLSHIIINFYVDQFQNCFPLIYG